MAKKTAKKKVAKKKVAKKTATRKTAARKTATSQAQDYAQEIWLAGLGAFSMAQQEGSNLYDQGRKTIEQTSSKVLGESNKLFDRWSRKAASWRTRAANRSMKPLAAYATTSKAASARCATRPRVTGTSSRKSSSNALPGRFPALVFRPLTRSSSSAIAWPN